MAKKTLNLPNEIKVNQARWNAAKFSPRRLKLAAEVAERLCAPKAKAIYKQLQDVTGVPWYIIAVIHEREASQKWDRNIAQGDRFNQVSTHVPKGRGPFQDFKSAAIDALTKCPPYAAKWKDWSEGGALTLLLLYNGAGPELYHNTPSGYLWAGTDQYTKGKYVRDGVWDGTEVDTQLGVAVLLKQMMALDPDVTFGQQPGSPRTIADAPEEGDVPEVDPATFPEPVKPVAVPTVDPDEPPAPTYEEGPPPASQPPVTSELDNQPWLQTAKDAIGSKIGTKTVAAGTAVTSTAVASADDSWFDAIGRAMHSPRFWIIAVIVVVFAGYLIYNCVENYKAKRA